MFVFSCVWQTTLSGPKYNNPCWKHSGSQHGSQSKSSSREAPMTVQAYLCIIPISSTRSAKADHAGPIFKKVNKLSAGGHIINKVAAENILYMNVPSLITRFLIKKKEGGGWSQNVGATRSVYFPCWMSYTQVFANQSGNREICILEPNK